MYMTNSFCVFFASSKHPIETNNMNFLWLGEKLENLSAVYSLIEEANIKEFITTFNKVDYIGENKEHRVLKLDKELPLRVLNLRKSLEQYDDRIFKEYIPHIPDLNEITLKMDRLYIACIIGQERNVLKEFKLEPEPVQKTSAYAEWYLDVSDGAHIGPDGTYVISIMRDGKIDNRGDCPSVITLDEYFRVLTEEWYENGERCKMRGYCHLPMTQKEIDHFMYCRYIREGGGL